jgi:hypothetical protein
MLVAGRTLCHFCKMKTLLPLFIFMLVVCKLLAELRVPAYTAYTSSQIDAPLITVRDGITNWKNPDASILWFGEFKTAGEIECSVALRLFSGSETELQLTVAGNSHAAKVRGNGTNLVVATFGKFVLPGPAYQSIAIASPRRM